MEGIEADIQSKSIERVAEPEPAQVQTKSIEKPKKPRTEAQKEAFEKARLKRAENLKKKKEQNRILLTAEEEDEYIAEQADQTDIPEPAPPPAPKRRGRPRKKKEEPPAPHFIQPNSYQPQNLYPIQGQQQAFNPYQYWGGMPPPQAPQPVVHNYYYGANPKETNQKETIREVQEKIQEPPPTPEPIVFEEEYEEEYELPADPRLKFRFA